MKSITLRIGTLIAALGLLSAPVLSADENAELQKVRATVSGMFDGIQADDVFASDIDGWYTIRKGAIIAYISADGRYLLQGDLIDLEGQVNLSEKDRNNARVKMMIDVSDDQAIVFTTVRSVAACIPRSTSTWSRASRFDISSIRAAALHRNPGSRPSRSGARKTGMRR